MKNIIILTSLAALLTACGGEPDSPNANKSTNASVNSQDSKPATKTESSAKTFDKYMAESNICGVLDVAQIKAMFSTEAEISSTATTFGGTNTCDYSWERTDREAREKDFLNHSMLVAQGKAKPKPMRQKVMEHQVSVSLSEYKGKPEFFVPAKLTDEQLQTQIDRAKQAAADNLTNEQKELAGDAANDMVESLLKKNNQNTEIEGVGDAAYWSKVGMGGLYVLEGNTRIYISPMIADTEEEDIENAKNIATILLK